MARVVRVETEGLNELVRALKGPEFRDVNKALRVTARAIAADLLVPMVSAAVARSGAPQAAAMAATVRPHSDRVPVVVVGKVNPRFASGFRVAGRRGGNGSAGATRLRRGSLARGVVAGPLGGKRSTPVSENYYRIGRDAGWGSLGHALATNGAITRAGCDRYRDEYVQILRRNGFDVRRGR